MHGLPTGTKLRDRMESSGPVVSCAREPQKEIDRVFEKSGFQNLFSSR